MFSVSPPISLFKIYLCFVRQIENSVGNPFLGKGKVIPSQTRCGPEGG